MTTWKEHMIMDAYRSAFEEARQQHATLGAMYKRIAEICQAQGFEVTWGELNDTLKQSCAADLRKQEFVGIIQRMGERLNADKSMTVGELLELGLSRRDPVAHAYEVQKWFPVFDDMLVRRLKAAELKLPNGKRQ